MSRFLTDRQQTVLDFLREFHSRHGHAPTEREIQAGLGFSSQSVARHYLTILERKGAISRQPGKARSLVIPDPPGAAPGSGRAARPDITPLDADPVHGDATDWETGEEARDGKADGASGSRFPAPRRMLSIPVYGSIAAGFPSDDGQQPFDTCLNIDCDTLHLPNNSKTFALLVRGESMTGAGILHGDKVILEFRDPRPGDIVAALIDGETTLKRFLVRRGQPWLKAENPAYPDLIPARELVIQGVMVALLRVPHDVPRPNSSSSYPQHSPALQRPNRGFYRG